MVGCLILVTLINGCSQSQKEIIPNTPLNTAILMKSSIDNGDYNSFQSLFTEGKKNSVSEDKFKNLKALSTQGSGYACYELVSFDNGKMLLIYLTPQKDNKGEYHIQDVKVVPDELKKYFK